MKVTCEHCGQMIEPIVHCVTSDDGTEYYIEECPECDYIISEGS